jgi:hypothetical protein
MQRRVTCHLLPIYLQEVYHLALKQSRIESHAFKFKVMRSQYYQKAASEHLVQWAQKGTPMYFGHIQGRMHQEAAVVIGARVFFDLN